tara:strand:+ start:138 stop:1064 length:927 start_codon:yes stop_codon:yes gene_type:complete
MKIYINDAKENWIADRFKNEWNKYNQPTRKYPYLLKNNIVWIIAPWTWRKIPNKTLKRNKVLCTIHHIDESKFGDKEAYDFYERDKYVDKYHIISDDTFKKIKKLTDKPIQKIPFWVNQNIWFYINEKNIIRKKYSLDDSSYLVGSFQRDTEGSDLKSPKLSKGPDRFIEIVKHMRKSKPNLLVVLTGKRRNYIIENLENLKIPYKYFEMTNFNELNELYNILDLYIVSSRVEGGPQSIVEASLTKTPVVSTNVGIAQEILSPESIFDMKNFNEAKPNIKIAYNNALNLKIPDGFKQFNEMMIDLYEN